jgi:hypothetical protein
VEVRYHPLFERWLEELAEADEEVFGEVMALLAALEQHGRDLEQAARDESHAIVTARYDLHALRRTPPTLSTPYATAPPVLRIVYGFVGATTRGRSPSRSWVATRQLSGITGIRRTSPKPRTDSTSTAVTIPT